MPNFKKNRGYKMKGHTLPGPNQKTSPVKGLFGDKVEKFAQSDFGDDLLTKTPMNILGHGYVLKKMMGGSDKPKEPKFETVKDAEDKKEKSSKQALDQDALLKAAQFKSASKTNK